MEQLLPELLEMCRWLAVPQRRLEAARALAQRLGASDLLVFICDPEIDAIIPAPGFARTLPSGHAWHRFVAAAQARGTNQAVLQVPPDGAPAEVLSLATDDGTLVALIGGAPRLDEVRTLRPVLPILGAALRGELAIQSVSAHAMLAEQSNAEAEALALSLDRARARLEALGHENGRLYREAQDAVRSRDQFLSIASHELRTPLTAVKSGAQILRRMHDRGETSTPRAQQVLQRVEHAVDRLSELTQDLLDVSSLRLGRLPLRLESVDLVPVIERVAAERRDYIDSKHYLKIAAAPNVPKVLIDAGRFEQVLSNLLDNAIKYSPNGGTIVLGVGPRDGGALVQVRDSGIGVPSGSEETIFEPFGRAANAQRAHVPGMGLGLYICRYIIQQHGGRIWVNSLGEQHGTAVNVWLPAEGA